MNAQGEHGLRIGALGQQLIMNSQARPGACGCNLPRRPLRAADNLAHGQ